LFLAVGAATGGATIAIVLGRLCGPAAHDVLPRLMRVISVALVTEIVALLLLIVSVLAAGSAGVNAALSTLLAGRYSVPFWLGAVFLGAVLPLLLQFDLIGHRVSTAFAKATAVKQVDTTSMTTFTASLVLVGGFLVKFVLIAAGQASLNGAG